MLVLPGTYTETLTISKGLTLKGIGGASGNVIISPAGTPPSVIEITTTAPVTLRGLTVHVPGPAGVRAVGEVDLTIEEAAILAPVPLAAASSNLVGVSNDLLDGSRARLGRVAAILVGPIAGNLPGPARPLTATGTVNIVGNTIRNSLGFCLDSAIAYEVHSGRIEHNGISGFVQACATPNPRSRPSAIWIGRLSAFPFPAVTPTVRFNDLRGNAQAGLRIAPNQTIAIEAPCNYWGSELGPSGIGPGDGSALVVDAGGAAPMFMPFATAPIAGSGASGC
jgi:hypothetical protein